MKYCYGNLQHLLIFVDIFLSIPLPNGQIYTNPIGIYLVLKYMLILSASEEQRRIRRLMEL